MIYGIQLIRNIAAQYLQYIVVELLWIILPAIQWERERVML